MKTFKVASLAGVVILTGVLFLMVIHWWQTPRNFAHQAGLPVPDSAVTFQYHWAGLIYDQHYVKAVLSPGEAAVLYRRLGQLTSSSYSISARPQDMPTLTGQPEWNPGRVKKYKSGMFLVPMDSDTYCEYFISTDNSKTPILYLYGEWSTQ